MEISFKTQKLAKIFNVQKQLIKTYGPRQAAKIQVRLAALRAAGNLGDFWPPYNPPERCHELTEGKRKGQLSMDIVHPYRLLFVPDHKPLPEREEGGLDWWQVTAIVIIEVEDTHG